METILFIQNGHARMAHVPCTKARLTRRIAHALRAYRENVTKDLASGFQTRHVESKAILGLVQNMPDVWVVDAFGVTLKRKHAHDYLTQSEFIQTFGASQLGW